MEDDPIICFGLEMALGDAGCRSLTSACCYEDALTAINAACFDYCILDLDLRNALGTGDFREPEGRRLLSVLRSRGVSTVVYSGMLAEQYRIRDLDPSVVTMDKTEPAEAVIAALSRLSRESGRRPRMSAGVG